MRSKEDRRKIIPPKEVLEDLESGTMLFRCIGGENKVMNPSLKEIRLAFQGQILSERESI